MSDAAMAQLVEHILGKDEVPSSNLGSSSKKALQTKCFFVLLLALLRKELFLLIYFILCDKIKSQANKKL